MPESTLKRFHELFPEGAVAADIRLVRGRLLRSTSRSSDSLWVKIDAATAQTRVVDGMLEITGKVRDARLSECGQPVYRRRWFRPAMPSRSTASTSDIGEEIRAHQRRGREGLSRRGGRASFRRWKAWKTHLSKARATRSRVRSSRPSEAADKRNRLRVSATGCFAYCREKLPRFKNSAEVFLVSENIHGARSRRCDSKSTTPLRDESCQAYVRA